MSDADETQRKFVRAKEMIGRGKQALSEGHRMLRQLSGDVRNARSRGMLHQLIWDCEKLGDQRTGFFSQAGQSGFRGLRVWLPSASQVPSRQTSFSGSATSRYSGLLVSRAR